ncbi:MAG: DegT/DnrJ/EryC1/StrS family aminotransferase [Nitrososphaeraceae archaeon]
MIPINQPWLDTKEKEEVIHVLDGGILTSASKHGGKQVQELELSLKEFLNVKHVIAVNSGTSALHASLLSINIQEGDEILLPSFTFVATANSVIAAGAKPVFVDINKTDYTMDINDLKNKITNKTKAIIPVHLYGHPSDMDEIIEIANNHSFSIIEDACQSLGSTYKNQQTGTIGKIGCFSMYASKVLTAGEGGAIATNDDNIADTLKMIRNHGMVEGYDTKILGLNLRLPELSAAIAKIQMRKFQDILKLRRKNAKILSDKLNEYLKKYNDIVIPSETDIKKFNWYLYTIAFHDSSQGQKRDAIKKKLNENGFGAAIYYNPPVHMTPYYKKHFFDNLLPNTEWASKNVLSLPCHPSISEYNVEKMVQSLIKELLK